jgi:hypothetical protein
MTALMLTISAIIAGPILAVQAQKLIESLTQRKHTKGNRGDSSLLLNTSRANTASLYSLSWERIKVSGNIFWGSPG